MTENFAQLVELIDQLGAVIQNQNNIIAQLLNENVEKEGSDNSINQSKSVHTGALFILKKSSREEVTACPKAGINY